MRRYEGLDGTGHTCGPAPAAEPVAPGGAGGLWTGGHPSEAPGGPLLVPSVSREKEEEKEETKEKTVKTEPSSAYNWTIMGKK